MAHDRDSAKGSAKDSVCKTCSRIIATISSDGDLVPTLTQDQACDTCRRFEELYAVLQTTNEAYRAVESRRKEYGPRVIAVTACDAARKAFNNYLLEIESTPGNDTSASPRFPADASQQRGQKRPLSPSSPQASAKRLRPTLNSSRRGVSFDNAVVFHDKESSRPDDAFNRRSDAYTPGRNAPPQGTEYLDTSGYPVNSWVQFLGVKKLGKGWVETKEGKEMDDEWQKQLEDENGVKKEVEEKHVVREKQENRISAPKQNGEELNADLPAVGDVETGDVSKSKSQLEQLEKELDPEEPSKLSITASRTTSSERTDEPSAQLDMETETGQSTNTAHTPLQVLTAPDINDIRTHNGRLPTPQEEDAELYTYGMGWSKKVSPNSTPKGIQWRAGAPESLSNTEVEDNLHRGR
ncbi:hypothetical protein CC80DRAFT_553062 [Byssothecium circinans]|uniref:Uncharacterized protein n=1 Tax=Byssothecium circinans TaxID=147558 RepID=A0A6A5TGH2_9PLEO|nr:hypothetical protein CC80DRAFT_553062 [Byssothecium circinans]